MVDKPRDQFYIKMIDDGQTNGLVLSILKITIKLKCYTELIDHSSQRT